MLVLSRKPGERIQIGENIWVTLVRVGPNTAKLGIEAPQGVNIAREELVAALQTITKPPAEVAGVPA
jgi:carbon storage regulator